MICDQMHLVVGVAWESGSDPYFNRVNVAIGLQNEIRDNAALDELDREMDALEFRMATIKNQLMGIDHSTVEFAMTSFESLPSEIEEVRAQVVSVHEETHAVAPELDDTGAPDSGEVVVDHFATDPKPHVPQGVASIPNQELMGRDDVDITREDLVDSYLSNFESSLEGLVTMDDVKRLAQQSGAALESNPEPIMNAHIAEFTERLVHQQFSIESIQSTIRRSVLNNPEMPMFHGIHPGTQAEARLVQQVQDIILKSLTEELAASMD